MDCPKRILIVDNDPTTAKLAQKICERMGLTTVAVSTCAEAIVAVTGGDLAAIILDLGIPRTVESARCLKELIKLKAQRGFSVPIIATTAHAMDGDRNTCLEFGVDDYLSEPYTLQQFTDTVSRWVKPERRRAS